MNQLTNDAKKAIKDLHKAQKALDELVEKNNQSADYWLIYNDLQTRHETEIEEKDKRYHKLFIRFVTSALIVILLIVSGFCYVINNFDFCSYTQDGNGTNQIVTGNNQGTITGSTEGDLGNEPKA